MKTRLFICLMALTVLLLILESPPGVYADELPQIPDVPALSSTPPLPSIAAFGTPNPPRVFADEKVYMPDVESWAKSANQKEDLSERMPIDPSYVAVCLWPVHGKISSGYGPRGQRMHEGIDIPVPSGTPIQAAAPGVVREARTYRGYGYTVILDHNNGMKTLYAHCSELAVKKGEQVESGQVIAYAGNTGRSTTSHVHFGVIIKGAFHDPIVYLKEGPRLANQGRNLAR